MNSPKCVHSRYCTFRATPLSTVVSRAKLSDREAYFKVIRLLLSTSEDRPNPLQRTSQAVAVATDQARPGFPNTFSSYLPSHRRVFPVGLEGGKCTRSEIFKRKKTRFHERHSFGFEAPTGEGGRWDPTRLVWNRVGEDRGMGERGWERKEREYPCIEHRDGR